MADIGEILGNVAQAGVPFIRITTRITPSIDIPNPLAPGGSGEPSLILKFLQPKIEPLDATGKPLDTIAPTGDPGDGALGFAIAATLFVASYVAVWILARKT